jgi:hypothetical protein
MNKIFITFSLTLFLINSTLTDALAEDEWEYKLIPLYLWATDIEGSTQFGTGAVTPVSVEFSDAVDTLEGALTLQFEAHKGNKGIIFNLSHINMTPGGVLPNGAALDIDLTDNIVELAGIYRPQNDNKLEVLYGLRYSDYELDATIGSMSALTLDESWLDAFVGLRTNVAVSEKSTISLRGDVGAGDSDMTWSASAFYDYRINDKFSSLIGYRWLDYDLELGSGEDLFVYDVTYQGPVLAVMYRW